MNPKSPIQEGVFLARLVAHTREINPTRTGFIIDQTYEILNQEQIKIEGSLIIDSSQFIRGSQAVIEKQSGQITVLSTLAEAILACMSPHVKRLNFDGWSTLDNKLWPEELEKRRYEHDTNWLLSQ